MTNPSKAPHEQQPPHQAPVDVEAAKALLESFGQPVQEQQPQEVPAQAPAPEISQPLSEADSEPTLADDLLSGNSGAENAVDIPKLLQERSEELPTLMGYSQASQAHIANPKESPLPQLFLDQVSPKERKQLKPNDVLLLPEDLILNASDEFIGTFSEPVQKKWREEAADRRNEFSQWTPEDVKNLAANGRLYEMPDGVAQHMPLDAQHAWTRAAGRPIDPIPFENSPVIGAAPQPTELPEGKFGGRFGRNKDTTATTQETEPAAADNSVGNTQETASSNYVFSEEDGIGIGSPFYGKSEKELIDEIFDMSDEEVGNLSRKEFDIYKRVESAAYELSDARAASNPDQEMVGPESDPGARGKAAKAAALIGKAVGKLTFRRGKGKQSETEPEAANEPGKFKKLTAALGGVASKAGNLVRRDKNGEGSGEQGEQQPKRPLKERAKELADKMGDLLLAAKARTELAVLDTISALPKIGQKLYERYTEFDPAQNKRVVTKEGSAYLAITAGLGLVALGTYFSVKFNSDVPMPAMSGGNANTDPSQVPQPGAAGGTSSSSTEVTTTTTGAPSSSEAADATTTTTGSPSSSTEVDTTTMGNPSSSVDTTEAAAPTGGSSTTTEVDTTTTGSTTSGTETSQAGNPGNVGAGEHAIDAETTTGSPSSSSTEQTTGANPTIDDRYPHNGGNGGTTPSPEAPATDTPDTPDQSTPEPGAPQAPDARGMDQVADPANQPTYSPGVSELQPGGNVWDSSEQFWLDRGFKGSPDDLNKLTDAMKDWRLEQMGISEADAVNLRPGTPLPMPTPDQISEIIARSGV